MTAQKREESRLLHDLHLNENDLTDEAKHLFPFHVEILESLNFCGRSILANESLTPAGRHIFCSQLIRRHENVKSVLNYLATKSLQSKEKITEVPMIIICGLPRTGTTLLHNLMACDLSCRAPLITDMAIQPIPPILRSNVNEHKRRMEAEALIMAEIFETAKCDIQQTMKVQSSSHAEFAYEEDTILHAEVGAQSVASFLAQQHTNRFTWLINRQNKDFVYEYHRTVLQMLHDFERPRTHWQLKSPLHTMWIDTLLKYYPQASLIMSHRRLDEVIPSSYRLSLAFNTKYIDKNDAVTLALILQQTIVFLDIWIERLIEFRVRQPPPKNVFDIRYEDLVRDPIATVRRIYDHFDFLQWSDEFEKAMREWLVKNPQGKQGRHSYSADEFGLYKDNFKELYKKYENMFLST